MLRHWVRIIRHAQRGATMPELLVAALVLSLVAAGTLVGYRSLSRAASASASVAEGNEALAVLQRVTEELGNAVEVTEARPHAVTAVASTSSSAVNSQYTDPATGAQGALRRYTVRYHYFNGTLYRSVDSGPARPLARYQTLQFIYYDANGNQTSYPASVQQIVVTARAAGTHNAAAKVIIGMPGVTGTASRGTSNQPGAPGGGGGGGVNNPGNPQGCPPGYVLYVVWGMPWLRWCVPANQPGGGSTPTPSPSPSPTPSPSLSPSPSPSPTPTPQAGDGGGGECGGGPWGGGGGTCEYPPTGGNAGENAGSGGSGSNPGGPAKDDPGGWSPGTGKGDTTDTGGKGDFDGGGGKGGGGNSGGNSGGGSGGDNGDNDGGGWSPL